MWKASECTDNRVNYHPLSCDSSLLRKCKLMKSSHSILKLFKIHVFSKSSP